MTRDKAAKRAARDWAGQTGESYTRARRAVRGRQAAAGPPAAGPIDPGPGDQQRWWRAYLLAGSDRIGELRQDAGAGDDHARRALASWLADRCRTGEAIEVIRPLADASDDTAQLWLARWLAESDEGGELQRRAGAGDWHALRHLAGWLAQRGDLGELRELLAGHPDLLTSAWEPEYTQHQAEVLRLRADLGDGAARQALAHALARARERARKGASGSGAVVLRRNGSTGK